MSAVVLCKREKASQHQAAASAVQVARYVLDSGTLFRSEEIHHLLRWGSPRSRPHFGPALRTLEEDTHGMKAGDAIGASHNCCEIFEIRREGWEIVVNPLRLDWQAF
ncbi:hypothetical protein KC330_g167 [Hortaea werneckii]|nr:hypothetical protein KC330_g167 [Hortaea werneckii]